MIRNVLFVVFWGHFTQTECGSCSADPKLHHRAKRSFAMCEHGGGVPRHCVLFLHRYICGEHSLIGRRNCFMTGFEFALSRRGPGIFDD